MTWPACYPQFCPPEESVPTNGGVYRLLYTETPQPIDFKSHRERDPLKPFPVPECQVCGLSVYSELEGAIAMRNRIPALREKKIGFGVLEEPHGMMLKTRGKHPSHHTWWCPIECEPWTFFTHHTEG